MKLSLVLETYDDAYAEVYNDTFLHDVWTKASVEFQISLLRDALDGARNWLDVACGTGYVLSRFPGVDRTGLDISEAMLDRAKANNPDATLVRRDYREPHDAWVDRFDVVSCMWWAYCLAETMDDVRTLIRRLAEWTSPGGTVIVPLCNVNKFDSHNIKVPYIDPKVPGRCMITGVVWAWVQESGKLHDDVITPQVEHMVAMFKQHFASVEVVTADPGAVGEGWLVQDVLVASNKRAQPQTGSLYPAADGTRAGEREWLLGVGGGALGSLHYPDFHDLHRARVSVARRGDGEPWNVQANKIGYPLIAGGRYRLEFVARAEPLRRIRVGVSLGDPPWTGAGLYESCDIASTWQPVSLEFVATESTPRGRIHFDLGEELGAVELTSVTFHPVDTSP